MAWPPFLSQNLGFDPRNSLGHAIVVHNGSIGNRIACGDLALTPAPTPTGVRIQVVPVTMNLDFSSWKAAGVSLGYYTSYYKLGVHRRGTSAPHT